MPPLMLTTLKPSACIFCAAARLRRPLRQYICVRAVKGALAFGESFLVEPVYVGGTSKMTFGIFVRLAHVKHYA